MLNYNFKTSFKNLNGEPIKEQHSSENGPTYLRDVCIGHLVINCLLVQTENEKNLSGESKLERHLLSVKINKSIENNDPISLSSEEVSLIKSVCSKSASILAYGQIYNFMENEGTK